jgi:glutamate synthase domain-containing protein 2
MMRVDIDWATQRLVNLFAAWRGQMVGILQRFGMRSVTELRGRTDCLYHLDYVKEGEAAGD